MPLQTLSLKSSYSTDTDNVLKDFYIPTLKNAVSYDRAVGFFSSNALLKMLEGIDGLINNNGYMRLVIGDTLSDEEYEAVKFTDDSHVSDRLSQTWEQIYTAAISDSLLHHRLNILSWLVKNKKLSIKYALRRKGLFHKKIGIISDVNNNKLVFSGSMNETQSAIIGNIENPDGNSEEIDVYRSWKTEIFKEHGQSKIISFENLWNNKEPNTHTIDISSEQYIRLSEIYSGESPPKSNIEQVQADIYDEYFDNNNLDLVKLPAIPSHINNYPFEIREHQLKALRAWDANDYQGIMALATGAGKTITSIYGAVKIANEGNRLFLVVAVPYKILAEQWCEVLSEFNISPIKCFHSKNNWFGALLNNVQSFKLGIKNFCCVVVVNRTLQGQTFNDVISKINSNELMFIGDECHHHSSENISKKLPDAKFKIGLSATPWSRKDVTQGESLRKYYGNIIATYSLKEALGDGILVNYEYYIHSVTLNEDEEEKYRAINKTIAQIAPKKNKTLNEQNILKFAIFKRARLLDGLEDKFQTLDKILQNEKIQNHTLFYCGAGSSENEDEDELSEEDGNLEERMRLIDKVTQILTKHNWSSSNFTYNESTNERFRIMDSFKAGEINALSAIKVLDEGFDVPICQKAYITASSSNERQYIQRRGRILRKSPGKKIAIIHDFVIMPSYKDSAFLGLVEDEFVRMSEFFKDAVNKDDFLNNASIQNCAKLYNIDLHKLIN